MRAWKFCGIIACLLVLPVAAMAQWSDNFDSYVSGSQLFGQGGWTSWNGDPLAGNYFVTNAYANSSPNSVAIDDGDDAVHTYTGANSGQWEYIAYQYVPSTGTSSTYFILLNTYPATANQHWSCQLEANPSTGQFLDFDAGIYTTLLTDQWVEIKVVIDLIADSQTVYYNGNPLSTKSWTAGSGVAGGALNVAAVDLWGNSTTYSVYYDDMSLQEVSFVTPTPTSTPVPVGPGDWCNEPLTINCGGCVEGTTTGAGNHFDTNDLCSAYIENFEGPDMVYRLVLTDVYEVTFLGQADYDADWAIVKTCDNGETDPIICFDNVSTITSTPSCSTIPSASVNIYGNLEYEAILGPGTFYIWADGFMTEAGNYALEVLCNPIPAAMECDAGSVWEQPGNVGTAYICDDYYPFYGAEHFTGGFMIESIKWWGIETTTLAPCTRDNPLFHISLYQNSGGLPGTVVWQGDLTPDSRTDTGEVFGVHGPIWAYTATLPAPVALTDGWIGIQAPESTTCVFGWIGVAAGDFLHANSNNGVLWATADDGLALCISGTELATATPAPIPATGPAGVGILIFVISAILGLSVLRLKK